MEMSLSAVPALLSGADAAGWLARNGLVWGALAVFFLLYRLRPRPARRQPDRHVMGLVAGGVAAVAFEWMV